ncbi:MAG: 2-hydroxyacyl-CoA dehydratase family protein [Dehalococcoidales bacterium]|jgi:benzoyl-CoA reductase/2-hydroxyglutaryl-CoA dehydratase subunit BcrC/BadD/HgdB|nr:2-hydroxyacyl-CoA dehydratase family protein [Dehalococcoidales bacterium]MDD5604973.1 2-hydroxyacyl-CoA dehydratase family protein [Dehalococcoidales bacterium]NLE90202.1 2-hydroxyacyl-CoA dehydratase [Dehalococcoidales bacterium]
MSEIHSSPGYSRLIFDKNFDSFSEFLHLFNGGSLKFPDSENKIIAKTPLSPPELIYAAGGLAYDPYTRETIIHSVMNENFDLVNNGVDTGLSPEYNPWNLIMAGSMASGATKTTLSGAAISCGNWDDQTKKTWQALSEKLGTPVYFWEIPRWDSDSEKWAIKFLKAELEQLFQWLQYTTGVKVTSQSLSDAVINGNRIRQQLQEIDELACSPGRPLSALEYYMLHLASTDYFPNPRETHRIYDQIICELRQRVEKATSNTPDEPLRIFMMGDETQQFQLFKMIEDCGGQVVGADFRLALYYKLIPQDGSILDNLAHWIWNMPTNMPTMERIRATIPFIQRQKADAVIINSTIGSRNLPGSERIVRDIIKQEMEIPVLSIETSLPLQDNEKTEYLIRAFIEMNRY